MNFPKIRIDGNKVSYYWWVTKTYPSNKYHWIIHQLDDSMREHNIVVF